METKEYFEKVMQDFRSALPLGSSKNQHRNGRSLHKYCQDEGIDYKWLQEYKRAYGDAFIFYSKDLKKVKILHYDINRFVIYAKWFDDGRFLSLYDRSASRRDARTKTIFRVKRSLKIWCVREKRLSLHGEKIEAICVQ